MLRKAMADLSAAGRPVAFVDLETFKEHSYPDVLLSVLIATLVEFKKCFESNSDSQSITTPQSLLTRMDGEITKLRDLLHTSDESEVLRTEAQSAGMEPATPSGLQRHQLSETSSTFRRTKAEYLRRHIMDYQSIFDDVTAFSRSDAFLFLDDLYHLRRDDQAQVIDYFHRVAKGRPFWLKIGTIRHRTQWYKHAQPPVGMKLGDDCDGIDLDITLEKYKSAKEFLFKILEKLIAEAGLVGYQELLADGAVDRLVLASGGVARDFLTIFRKSITHALERGEGHARGGKIGAEDVNGAAGEHDTTKRDELRRDASDEREKLEAALANIQQFCCLENNVNLFLVAPNVESPGAKIIGELLDLRFLHLAASRVTVRDDPGALRTCYLLDVSQYTGARLRRDLTMVEFWKKSGLDRIRRSKYVFDPDRAFFT
jgi:hypothetical protein